MDTLIMGVNDEVLTPEDTIVALGSNTSNAVAPVLKVLHDTFGVEAALFTTVHALTNDARLADGARAPRCGAAARAENIIPGHPTPGDRGAGRSPPSRARWPDWPSTSRCRRVQRGPGRLPLPSDHRRRAERHPARRRRRLERSGLHRRAIVSSDIIGSEYSATVDGLSTLVMMGLWPSWSSGTTTAGATPPGP